MRIGIFSDLHGNQYALHAFMQRVQALALDSLIFCGDIFGYYYGQAEIMDTFDGLQNFYWILGNHDKYYLDMTDGKRELSDLTQRYGLSYKYTKGTITQKKHDTLLHLSSKIYLSINNINICVVHGTPDSPLEGRLYPLDSTENIVTSGIDILIMGHTHFRMHKKVNSTILLNPGSLGQPRDRNPAGIAILTLPDCNVEFIDIAYDRESLVDEIRAKEPENKKLIDILYRA
ncbi:metallophosphoesterase [Spirochaetia bacterium]|nr:metallophosphoesterase [Spirochaetia bacterium]